MQVRKQTEMRRSLSPRNRSNPQPIGIEGAQPRPDWHLYRRSSASDVTIDDRSIGDGDGMLGALALGGEPSFNATHKARVLDQSS